ncbi:MAG: GyrI-like domain-containing protein [Chloroflexi bacterium]|nr:GyrI-like domain-containing protein [Chloroflexota bacterium]
MDPKIVTAKEWLVVGMSFYGDPFSQTTGWSEDNEIGLLWKRFFAFHGQNADAIKHIAESNALLEIHIETEETPEKGLFEVFIGVRVEKLEDVPIECVVKILPATQYAVFTLQAEEITSDWSKLIYFDWIPASGYYVSHQYGIQYYDHRFKGLDKIEESMLDVYVPIEKSE